MKKYNIIILIMNIRGRDVNIWKWVVLAWGAHKAMKAGRALLKAKRLAKKKVRRELVTQYADL